MGRTQTYIGKNSGNIIQKEFLLSEKSILISSPAISFSIWKIIFDIMKKGIKIKIVTSEKGGSDSETTNQFAMKLINGKDKTFSDLLEYKIVKKSKVKIMHPKFYIIDDKCAIVGSANLTDNGFHNYIEFIQVFKEREQVDIIREDFNKLWALF
jgi:phosphatidylserine/phosphatidylglycerophosphate/cardiolipin synthase-like enzyme